MAGIKWWKNSKTFRKVVVTSLIVLGLYLILIISSNISFTKRKYLLTVPAELRRTTLSHQAINKEDNEGLRGGKEGVNINNEGLRGENEGVNINNEGATKLITAKRVLLLYDRPSLGIAKAVKTILQSHRVPFDTYLHNPNRTLTLVKKGGVVGKYCLIICADMAYMYQHLSSNQLSIYLDYSRLYNVTSIYFINSLRASEITQIDNLVLLNVSGRDVKGLHLNSSKEFYYLRSQEWIDGNFTNNSLWTALKYADSAHYRQPEEVLVHMKYRNVSHDVTTPLVVTHTRGGARNVVIGSPIWFWMTKLVLLEVIRSYSLHPVLRFGRERWLMVDIDDIFVAPLGLKMTAEDVQVLVDTQSSLQTYVKGLTFNLGFCGQFYNGGTELEINGSHALVRNRDLFWWFGHTYNHYQLHSMKEEDIRENMETNLEFSINYSIPSFKHSYAVSPHHSGVYPVHAPLFRVWSQLVNVTMTTTEEYPHLYPDYGRRGFIHMGVMVLPRQTCRLFTHTYMFQDFGKGGKEDKMGVALTGKAGLMGVAQGGEVFNTILSNPVNIFMTHVTNYSKDRLAPFMFTELFKFITRWTRLELRAAPPLTLGEKYFSIFPEDKVPIWTSPCDDKRHMAIWSPAKSCVRLPSVLVLGPQKTGTTALHLYMRAHPNITSNFKTKDHFEEVQFFSNQSLYNNGIDWYMNQFPSPTNQTQVIFEKSATYFSHLKAPMRMFSLLPRAKLIIIIQDPVTRAYSWYQHMRAHGDITALNYSFIDVVQANNISSPTPLLHLREHCLLPGKYYMHIINWFGYYSPSQVLFLDGEVLARSPAEALDKVQHFLGVEKVDYTKLLRYNQHKGYYCVYEGKGHLDCLGPGKGRGYPPLHPSDIHYTRQLFHKDNLNLYKLLKRLRREIPVWLKQDFYTAAQNS